MTRINFIITAGGTREPIDEVRYVGNVSTGRLGAEIAEEAHRRNHAVRFIHGIGSCLPSPRGPIAVEPFATCADLNAILKDRVAGAAHPAVLVHAAAVADFTPAAVPGKISSRQEELVLRLKRTPKIVDQVKKWNPRILLVKFKLEAGRTPEELLAIARTSRRRSNADWIVANDISEIEGNAHPALILARDGRSARVEGKKNIAKRLVEDIEKFVSSRAKEE